MNDHRDSIGGPVTGLPRGQVTNGDVAALREGLAHDAALPAFEKDWELGRWGKLAETDVASFEGHPDIVTIVLLIAEANQQLGKVEKVRELVQVALDNGCTYRAAIQALVAGVHNILGRARLASGDREEAERQFEQAIALGVATNRRTLVAAAREIEQSEQLAVLTIPKRGGTRAMAAGDSAGAATQYHAEDMGSTSVVNRYRQAPRGFTERNEAPFVLLDSKSMPRSGLHYLKRCFEKRLGPRFSFCEWYQEPGCCKQQPCALAGFMDYRCTTAYPTVRLVKSHDFELADPLIPPSFSLRRVILKRDPLFLLTSWFALDQLKAHKISLRNAGIALPKIWLNHEPEVLSMAYDILENDFTEPAESDLRNWLLEKERYIKKFCEKWITPSWHSGARYVSVLDYTEVEQFTEDLLRELGEHIDCGARERSIRTNSDKSTSHFRPRSDPFRAPSEKLSTYLRLHETLFRDSAIRCLRETPEAWSTENVG